MARLFRRCPQWRLPWLCEEHGGNAGCRSRPADTDGEDASFRLSGIFDDMPLHPSASATPRLDPFPQVPAGRLLVVCLAGLLLGAGVVLGYEHLRFESWRGELQAVQSAVVGDRPALCQQWCCEPGEAVHPGQPLVVLHDASLQQRLRHQRRAIEAAESELTRLTAECEMRVELERRTIEDRLFEIRLKLAELGRAPPAPLVPSPVAKDRWPTLADAGLHPLWRATQLPRRASRGALPAAILPSVAELTPRAETSPAPFDWAVARRMCDERILELERLRDELPGRIGQAMKLVEQQSELEFARHELSLLEAETARLTVRAAVTGRVGLLQKQAGEPVVPGDVLVQLFDDERLYLVMKVPSSRVGDFPQGSEVELSFPGGRRGRGRVSGLAPQAESAAIDGVTTGERVVEIRLTPTGPLWPTLPWGTGVTVRKPRSWLAPLASIR